MMESDSEKRTHMGSWFRSITSPLRKACTIFNSSPREKKTPTGSCVHLHAYLALWLVLCSHQIYDWQLCCFQDMIAAASWSFMGKWWHARTRTFELCGPSSTSRGHLMIWHHSQLKGKWGCTCATSNVHLRMYVLTSLLWICPCLEQKVHRL